MNKKYALLTVFLVVLVDLMGFGIVLPLLPFYASKFDASALTIGLLYSVYSFAQLIFSPFWGSLSDRIGRRPVMLVSTLGASVAYLLFAFSGSLWVLFLSRLLAGIMGGNISTAQAYIADVTTEDNRAKGMGMLGAAFGIGFVAGPAISSIMMHGNSEASYIWPGLIAAGLSAMSFFLVVFFLPETVQPGSKVADDATRVQRLSIFSRGFWVFMRDSKSGLLPTLLICVLLLSIGQSSLYSAFPLYCKAALSLTPRDVGMQFVYMGLVAIVIQGGLIRRLVKRFGEKKLFLAGNILMIAGLALIPLAWSKLSLTLILCLMGVGGSLNGPTITSLISKEAKPGAVGRVMGCSQGFSALGRVIGPAWGGVLFSASPKLPFFLTASLLAITVFFGLQVHDSIDSATSV